MSAPSSGNDMSDGPVTHRAINRIAAATLLAFAALFLFMIIPAQVDSASYGWMRPRTMPYICVAAIGVLSLCLLVFPKGHVDPAAKQNLWAFLILVGLGVALWAMSVFGFLIIAPILAMALVFVLRENRPLWILISVLAVPGIIWFVVEWLLGRSLP